MSAGITPNTLLTVDGSLRTLTWVDVIPSTRVSVAGGEGGSEVSVGDGSRDVGRVDVTANEVLVGVVPPCVLEPHPVLKSVKASKAAANRMDTVEF
jgi:hypothetical protein